jgi:hypothetical protein
MVVVDEETSRRTELREMGEKRKSDIFSLHPEQNIYS